MPCNGREFRDEGTVITGQSQETADLGQVPWGRPSPYRLNFCWVGLDASRTHYVSKKSLSLRARWHLDRLILRPTHSPEPPPVSAGGSCGPGRKRCHRGRPGRRSIGALAWLPPSASQTSRGHREGCLLPVLPTCQYPLTRSMVMNHLDPVSVSKESLILGKG